MYVNLQFTIMDRTLYGETCVKFQKLERTYMLLHQELMQPRLFEAV